MNFSGVVVDPVFDLADRLRRYLAEVSPLREPPADHFIQIFVRPSLIRRIGVTIIDLCPVAFPATGLFYSLAVGEFGTVVDGDRLEYLIEGGAVLTFKAIQGRDDASACLVLHRDNDFFSGLSFGQNQKGFLRLFLAFDTVHFPVTDGFPGVDLFRAVFNTFTGGRTGSLLHAVIGTLLLALFRKAFVRNGQKDAFVDIGIKGRFTDRRLEFDSLFLDFAQDSGRRIAFFADLLFDILGQGVILTDLQIGTLRRQVFPVCRFSYVRTVSFFFGQV